MADSKLADLPLVIPLTTDIIYVVSDPSGTPTDRKATVGSLISLAPIAIGIPGVDGESGEDGFPGVPGVQGIQGQQGIQGDIGSQGLSGVPGIPGLDGIDGEQGEEGVPGSIGPQGNTGAIGSQGIPGEQGPMGFPGLDADDPIEPLMITGPMGATGAPGSPGTQGANGISGLIGPPGLDAEEPEMPYVIPGQKGDTGPQGPAGGGGGSATTIEQNLGSTATWRGKFTITDATITPTSKVLAWQAPGPYTGKGVRADEAELQPVSVIVTEPAAGSAIVKWQTPPIVTMQVNPRMGQWQTGVTNVVTNPKDPQNVASMIATRIHKVRGNVKFTYMVL